MARGVLKTVPLDDVAAEITDFPAAIVCARCGSAECPGCEPLESGDTTASGVVVFVPWERPQGGFIARLWGTTRASTEGADAFFSHLPDGPLGPSLGFALVGETMAVGSSVATFFGLGLGGFSLAFPALTAFALRDHAWQAALLRIVSTAWLSFTLVLVSAHALHGAMLHLMATREGASGNVRKALRFGLYAVGWDIATSPLGLVIALFAGGLPGLRATRTYAFRTPGSATSAMLRGLYHLEGARAARARSRAMAVTMSASVAAIILACLAVLLSAR